MKKILCLFGFVLISLLCFINLKVSANDLTGFVNIKSFYIGQYPVTNAEYKAFIDSTSSKAPSYWKGGTYPNGKSNHPVVFVSYNDALSYCKWLEKKYPEYSFRLPTVSEWEYAANGGNGYAYPWGNQINDSNFNYNKLVASVYLKQNPTVTYNNPKSTSYGKSMPLNQVISINQNGVSGWIDHKNYTGFVYTDLFKKIMDNGGYTTPVNQYPNGKSPFGVYDMSGNVWEWTSSQITATNGAEKGQTVYAVKGGSWYANPNSCKITMSGEGRRPNTGYNTVGFRVVAVKKGTLTNNIPSTNSVPQSKKEFPNNVNSNNNFNKGNPPQIDNKKINNKNGYSNPQGNRRPSRKPDSKPGGDKTPTEWN